MGLEHDPHVPDIALHSSLESVEPTCPTSYPFPRQLIIQLYESHAHILKGNFLRKGIPYEDALDLVQDVFLRLLNSDLKEPEINTMAGITYMFRASHSVETDRTRRLIVRERHRAPSPEARIEQNPSFDIEDETDMASRIHERITLIEALNDLPEEIRALLFQRHILDIPLDELAASYQTTVASIKARLTRANKELAKQYRLHGGMQ